MAAHSFTDLIKHHGHKIVCVAYGKTGNAGGADAVAVECETCHEVLLDFDREDDDEL